MLIGHRWAVTVGPGEPSCGHPGEPGCGPAGNAHLLTGSDYTGGRVLR